MAHGRILFNYITLNLFVKLHVILQHLGTTWSSTMVYMSYTTNPKMPAIRQEAVRLCNKGWSARKVGRYLGFHHTAIMKWKRRARLYGSGPIPTRNSRPKQSPQSVDPKIRDEIIQLRLETKRCADVIYLMMKNRGVSVSRTTVHRVLSRSYLLNTRSPWKRYHPPVSRPVPVKSGDLVEVDTIHRMIDEKRRLYVMVLLDVYSRFVYARAYARINAATSVRFITHAQSHVSFHFSMLQSDHGPEFGNWFVSQVRKKHRYTRIGKPNDNAHIERFNRTLQEEYLDKLPDDVRTINCGIKKYLRYYNRERLHLGISLQTPIQFITNRLQAIG